MVVCIPGAGARFWSSANFVHACTQTNCDVNLGWLVLSCPDVSREHMCLQTSPQQLKDKNDKNSEHLSREAREFLGSWNKNSNTAQMHQFHTSQEFAFRRTKFPDENWTMLRMFGIQVLRIECLGVRVQEPSWGQQKRRKPLVGTFRTHVLSGLRWLKVA